MTVVCDYCNGYGSDPDTDGVGTCPQCYGDGEIEYYEDEFGEGDKA